MKTYEIRRTIIDTEESLELDEPFTFVWAIGPVRDIELSEDLYFEFEAAKKAIKQKAAREMLELFKNTLQKIEK